MADETIYRCVNPSCARQMPRPVKFCPWCGTAQAGVQAPPRNPELDAGPQADAAAQAAQAAQAAEVRRAVEATAAATAAAELSGWSDAPASPLPSAPDAAKLDATRPAAAPDAGGTAAARAGLAGARVGAGADAPARGGRLGTLFGHGAGARATPPPAESVPRPPIPPRPVKPQREPIRLRYWVLVLGILWAVWLVARPNSSKKIEQRIDHAVALAQECKATQAQDELIALRKTRATPEQLERMQTSLNEGAAACTRKRQRDKAWADASAAAEGALAEGNPERARARLQAFTRRYGDDDRSRALRQRIEDARHPLAAPSG